MSSDFEKMMNEKMEQAKPEELMPCFDRNAAWENISERIPSNKKTRVLPVWWTHAAAVVVGILIGSSLLLLQNKQGNTPTVATIKETGPLKEIVRETDTVFITKEIITYTATPAPRRQPVVQQPKSNPLPETAPPQEVLVQEKPIENPIPVAPQPEITPEPEKQEIKVVHLLDIENEDRKSALNNYDPAEEHRSGFALQMPTRRLPNRNTDQPKSLLNSIRKNK